MSLGSKAKLYLYGFVIPSQLRTLLVNPKGKESQEIFIDQNNIFGYPYK